VTGHFAVIREAGPGWIEGMGPFEQPQAAQHAAFMSSLAEAGIVICAGPLGDGHDGPFRVLLIAQAESAAEVARRLAADPWTLSERLLIASVEPWSPLVGADRLVSARPGLHD
jgi:uncharacterized protein YciI